MKRDWKSSVIAAFTLLGLAACGGGGGGGGAPPHTPSWGTAVLIETDNAGSAYSPQIAVDAGGNAWAVWEQSDGTRYSIWANRYE